MSDVVVTDDIEEVSQSKELDSTKLSRLLDLKRKISQTGLVSKNDIISTEDFVGYNIITNDLPLNGYTDSPSLNCSTETIEAYLII